MIFAIFQTDLNVTGELSVTVNFQMPGTLYVTVHGANSLSPRSGSQSADPFVKVAVPGVGSVFSSQVQWHVHCCQVQLLCVVHCTRYSGLFIVIMAPGRTVLHCCQTQLFVNSY